MKKAFYGSRDHARVPMQWSHGENAGFSSAEPWIKVNPNFRKINVEDEEKDENSVLNHYRRLIALRKQNKALIYGSFEQIKTSADYFAYYRRKGGQKFMIVINLTDKTKDFPFAVDAKLICSNYVTYANHLRPYEADIFEL